MLSGGVIWSPDVVELLKDPVPKGIVIFDVEVAGFGWIEIVISTALKLQGESKQICVRALASCLESG